MKSTAQASLPANQTSVTVYVMDPFDATPDIRRYHVTNGHGVELDDRGVPNGGAASGDLSSGDPSDPGAQLDWVAVATPEAVPTDIRSDYIQLAEDRKEMVKASPLNPTIWRNTLKHPRLNIWINSAADVIRDNVAWEAMAEHLGWGQFGGALDVAAANLLFNDVSGTITFADETTVEFTVQVKLGSGKVLDIEYVENSAELPGGSKLPDSADDFTGRTFFMGDDINNLEGLDALSEMAHRFDYKLVDGQGHWMAGDPDGSKACTLVPNPPRFTCQ